MSQYFLANIAPGTYHVFSHLMFTKALQRGYNHYFIGKEVEA